MDSQILNNAGFFQAVFTFLGVILVYRGLKNWFNNKANEKPASNSTSARRRLGKNEAFMNLLSRERQGTSDVSLILSLRSETKLIKEHVHQALVLLAKRQPMLRAIIRTSTSSGESAAGAEDTYFEIMDGDKVTDMIDLTSSEVKARRWNDVWQEVALKERGTRLLWKAVMLQEEFLSEAKCYTNTLIFNFNRCCVDGVSSMKFTQQFLHYLNGLAEGSITSDKNISSLSLSPSIMDLLTREGSWSLWPFLASCLGIPWITKLFFKKVLRRALSHKKCNPFFAQFPPNPKLSVIPRSNMIFKIFNEIETSNIVKACRLNGCTVTGALMAANHLAFCKLLQNAGCSCKDVLLDHHFTINSQRDCQPRPPKEYLGHFSCGQTLFFPYADHKSDFWKVAEEATKCIHDELKEEKYARQSVGFFTGFSPEEILNEAFSPLDRQNLVRLSMCSAVSSVGSFDFRKEQKHHRYKLHECLFNALVHGLPFSFAHFNTTVNGKMSWVIKYDPSRVINGSQAQRFANLCFDYLIQICQVIEKDKSDS